MHVYRYHTCCRASTSTERRDTCLMIDDLRYTVDQAHRDHPSLPQLVVCGLATWMNLLWKGEDGRKKMYVVVDSEKAVCMCRSLSLCLRLTLLTHSQHITSATVVGIASQSHKIMDNSEQPKSRTRNIEYHRLSSSMSS
jgi:hypothetical protein